MRAVPVYSRWNPAAETLISELKLRWRLLDVLFRRGGMVVPANTENKKRSAGFWFFFSLSDSREKHQNPPTHAFWLFSVCELFLKQGKGITFYLRHVLWLRALFKCWFDLLRPAKGKCKVKTAALQQTEEKKLAQSNRRIFVLFFFFLHDVMKYKGTLTSSIPWSFGNGGLGWL